jgi:alkylhydroperoxidase family enzyme
MPNIEPVPMESITDPELRELVLKCEQLGVPDALLPRILARVPSYAKAMLRALLMSHTEGNIDHRLKEIIRVQLARFAGDPYFSTLRSKRAQAEGLDEETISAGSGDYDEDDRFTEAERLALRYSDLMYLNPQAIDKAFYDELKKHYSEAQIMELGAFVAFHYGMQCFMRTLDAQPLARESQAKAVSA